jgi:hypothetical protein
VLDSGFPEVRAFFHESILFIKRFCGELRMQVNFIPRARTIINNSFEQATAYA